MGKESSSEEDPGQGKPLTDRGWAWVCLIGVFIVNLIVIGTFKSFGILYVEAMEVYHTTAGQAAWIFTCVGITNTATPTFAAAFSNRFGNRAVVVVGGVVFACGSIFTTFTSGILQMIFVFGLFTGAGIGLVYANSMAMIPKYFEKRRAFAMGLSVAGSSVGQFVVPPIIRYLMDTFSFQGAMLVYGAFLLNVCLCGALFRPVKKYKAIPQEEADIVKSNRESNDENVKNPESLAAESSPLTGPEESQIPFAHQHTDATEARGSNSAINSITDNNCQVTHRKGDMDPEVKIQVDFKPKEENDSPTKVKNSCCQGIFLDFSLFKEYKFIIYLLGTWLATLGYANSFIIIPPNAKQLGINKQQTAFLLAVIGAGDLIGRVGFGFLSDLKFVRRILQRYHIYLICIGIVGVAHILCPFATSHVSLAVYCVFLGLFGGGFIALMVVVLADWVGVSRINSAMGFTVMVQGFGNTITPLILGQLRDITGTYAASFRFCGAAMIVGSFVFLFAPMIFKKPSCPCSAKTEERY